MPNYRKWRFWYKNKNCSKIAEILHSYCMLFCRGKCHAGIFPLLSALFSRNKMLILCCITNLLETIKSLLNDLAFFQIHAFLNSESCFKSVLLKTHTIKYILNSIHIPVYPLEKGAAQVAQWTVLDRHTNLFIYPAVYDVGVSVEFMEWEGIQKFVSAVGCL